MSEIETLTNEVVIELDSTLEPEAISERYLRTPEDFNKRIREKSDKDNLETVRDCISGNYRHMNYLSYLELAWNHHLGVVFSPDTFWHLFLSEIASNIKDNAEEYRSLFTEAEEGKTDIVVSTADPQLIDLNLIAEQLHKLVPTDSSIFLPEFTTSTESSALAFKAAFADAMSPYYNYFMLACGIPKIKLLGDESDWDKVIERIDKFREILNLDDYLGKVAVIAEKIKDSINNPDVDFWNNMFSLNRCGSGSQVTLNGWISDLFIKTPRTGYIENYSQSVSFVSYTFLNTGQKFELAYGLFSSNRNEDNYLVPEFGYIINEEIK